LLPKLVTLSRKLDSTFLVGTIGDYVLFST